MGYLFGDSTPFPVEDNFLATLADLNETCVTLLQVDADLEEARDSASAAKGEAVKEQARLDAIGAQLVRGLDGHAADPIAGRILAAARGVLEAARSENTARRDATLREVESAVAQRRAALTRAIESFLSRHELPGTVWQLRWRAGASSIKDAAQPQAQVKAQLPCNLEAVIELAIPLNHMWMGAPRVADLEREVAIKLPFEKKLLRKGGLRPEKLDRWHVTEVDMGPLRQSFVLRRSVKAPSDGVEVVLRTEEQDEPTARRLSAGGVPIGDLVVLDPEDVIAVKRLWSRMRATLEELKANRRRLVGATVDGQPLREIVRPARIAEKLIETVAPLVREIHRRGATQSELVLKRDLASGRREELFLPREELTRVWTGLTPGRKALFDAWGLTGGVVQAIPPRAPAALPPPIPNDVFEAGPDTQVETREFGGPPARAAMN